MWQNLPEQSMHPIVGPYHCLTTVSGDEDNIGYRNQINFKLNSNSVNYLLGCCSSLETHCRKVLLELDHISWLT